MSTSVSSAEAMVIPIKDKKPCGHTFSRMHIGCIYLQFPRELNDIIITNKNIMVIPIEDIKPCAHTCS